MKILAALFLFAALPAIAQTTPPAAPPSLKAQLAKAPLAGVMIPEVVIDQASLADAIAMFTTLVETNTKGSIKLQWFDRGFVRKQWKPTVTITAKNLSAGKLLNEILSQAGLEARLEEHAIVLSPKTKTTVREVPVEKKAGTPKVEAGGVDREGLKNPLKNR
jgi:hypothetical protein